LLFERRYPDENTVARLKANILQTQNFELSTPQCHCIAASTVKDVWDQQSHEEKRINYRNLKWTFENSLPC